MAEFAVVGNDRAVEAWSRFRLPFEPRAAALEFRSALRIAIARLTPDGAFRCEYGSAVRSFCDVENVLLYNVGMSFFRPLTQAGIVFERSYRVPRAPSPETYGHYHRYAVGEGFGFTTWEPTTVVARWQGRTPSGSATKPESWWLASATALREQRATVDFGAVFGLRIRMGTGRATLSSTLKPMLDGMIAALHCDRAPSTAAVERLAARLAWPASSVEDLLRRDPAPLGARTVVRPYRKGVQWNPVDDL